MATATVAPPLTPRYESRNSLTGKWPAVLRRAAWMMLLIYAMVMIGVNFVHLHLGPTISFSIQRFVYRHPSDYARIIGVALAMGAFAAAIVIAALAASVRLSYVGVFRDRLRFAPAGWGCRDVMFRDVVGVELVTFSSWPRRGSFWADLERQFQYLGTIHWTQHGMSQFFNDEARLVLVKVAGRKWLRGYLLDVDDPDRLMSEIHAAVSDYSGANGPAIRLH